MHEHDSKQTLALVREFIVIVAKDKGIATPPNLDFCAFVSNPKCSKECEFSPFCQAHLAVMINLMGELYNDKNNKYDPTDYDTTISQNLVTDIDNQLTLVSLGIEPVINNEDAMLECFKYLWNTLKS